MGYHSRAFSGFVFLFCFCILFSFCFGDTLIDAIPHANDTSTVLSSSSVSIFDSWFVWFFFSFFEVLFTILLVLSLCVWWLQGYILYMPIMQGGSPDDRLLENNSRGFRSPAEYHMPYQDVYIHTKDNIYIHAWFITQQNNKNDAPTIIFFHGNAGNIGFRLPNAKALYDHCKANILMVDYRGYGKHYIIYVYMYVCINIITIMQVMSFGLLLYISYTILLS